MIRNKFPIKKVQNIKDYIIGYRKSLDISIDRLNIRKIEKISNLILTKIKKNRNIFFCGNGGSSSISNHFLCDFQKGLLLDANLRSKFYSLSANTDLSLAIANDISFDQIFKLPLECIASKNDLLIIFSVSGSSKNLIEAAKYAKKNNIDIVSLTGFESPPLKKISDINLDICSDNYGVSEDAFSIIMHVISQYIRQKMFKKNFKNKKF